MTLQTDGSGEVTVGSVRGSSDKPLSGVIVFGGAVGLGGIRRAPNKRHRIYGREY